MPFVLLELRPVGDKRGSYRVLISNQLGARVFRDRALASVSAKNIGDTYAAALLLEYGHTDRITAAWAAKEGKWRKLELIVKP